MTTEEKLKKIMAKVAYFQALKGVNDKKTAEDIGMSRQMFSLYRKGHSVPTIEKLIEIANYLGCTLEDLVREEVGVNGSIQ